MCARFYCCSIHSTFPFITTRYVVAIITTITTTITTISSSIVIVNTTTVIVTVAMSIAANDPSDKYKTGNTPFGALGGLS